MTDRAAGLGRQPFLSAARHLGRRLALDSAGAHQHLICRYGGLRRQAWLAGRILGRHPSRPRLSPPKRRLRLRWRDHHRHDYNSGHGDGAGCTSFWRQCHRSGGQHPGIVWRFKHLNVEREAGIKDPARYSPVMAARLTDRSAYPQSPLCIIWSSFWVRCSL